LNFQLVESPVIRVITKITPIKIRVLNNPFNSLDNNKKIGTIKSIQISIAERYHSGIIKALLKSDAQIIII